METIKDLYNRDGVWPIVTRCRPDSTCWWSCTISRHQALQRRNEEGVLRLSIRSTQGAGITAIEWP